MVDLLNKLIKKLQNLKKKLDLVDIVYNIDGMILTKVYDVNFEANKITAQEIRKYCEEQGFEIDKIFFLNIFDLSEKEERNNFRAKSNSRLFLVNTGKKSKCEAYFFTSAKIKIS